MTNNSERIDFEQEFRLLEITYFDMSISESERTGLKEWARSIAERVENQTIERCGDTLKDSQFKYFVPRLYGPKPDKEDKP